MQRREMLGALGLGTATLVVTGRAGLANEQDTHSHDEHIEVMALCAKHCNEAANHCLGELSKGEGDLQYHAKAAEIALSCAEFCILSAKLMARNSALAQIAHEADAKACDACAEVCEQSDDPIMKECAESCRKCAEVCRQIAQHGQHQH